MVRAAATVQQRMIVGELAVYATTAMAAASRVAATGDSSSDGMPQQQWQLYPQWQQRATAAGMAAATVAVMGDGGINRWQRWAVATATAMAAA